MSCPAISQAYTKPCRDHQGGVKKFWITETANIASYTVSSGVVTAMTMVSGKKFWLYEQIMGTANAQEVTTPNRINGTVFTDQTFTAILNKRDASKSYSLKALSQNDVTIIPYEQTGTAFVFGLVNGMAMEPSTSTTGTAMGDANNYTLVWKGMEAESAPTIAQSIIDTITV